MMSSAAVPLKHSGARRKRFRARTKTVRLPVGITVRLQPGIPFVFTPESFSRSPRNPVRLAPESATQAELAEKVGIIQTIVSAIETNALKLSAEMAIRFALALEVSTDDLLLPAKKKRPGRKPSRRVLRRLEQIEALPSPQQSALLKTIDTFLENAEFWATRR